MEDHGIAQEDQSMRCLGTTSQDIRVRTQHGLVSSTRDVGMGPGASGEAVVVQEWEQGSSDLVLSTRPSVALQGTRDTPTSCTQSQAAPKAQEEILPLPWGLVRARLENGGCLHRIIERFGLKGPSKPI